MMTRARSRRKRGAQDGGDSAAAAADAAAWQALTPEQREAVSGIRPEPDAASDTSSAAATPAWRRAAEDPSRTFLWIGIGVLVQNVGDATLGNMYKQAFTLEESNVVDDVRSVTEVIRDIFSFFEDGMTVLIGAAVGGGDAAGAGILVGLGFGI